jgi:predicted polyphosphate/ATP-dependent NAD kinase
MNIRKWAFIYTLDDGSTEPRVDELGSLVCVGITKVADAPAAARRLVADGVELIELCGGFGGAGLGAVVSAVKGRVPVGAVFFGVEASTGLTRLDSSAAADLQRPAERAPR